MDFLRQNISSRKAAALVAVAVVGGAGLIFARRKWFYSSFNRSAICAIKGRLP